MTDCPDTRALARQRILSALDEVVAQIVFQADRLERLHVAVPLPIARELAQRVTTIVLALACYREGAYRDPASLAIIADPGQELDYEDWPVVV
jgi:hypothetical protein